MHKPTKWMLLFFLTMMLLPALACGVGGLDLPEVNVPEGAAATAEGLAQDAATAMARVTVPPGARETVAAVGQDAATAVAAAGDGGGVVATAQAADFTINVTLNTTQLREKIASARPDANGNIAITITDDEINQALEMKEQVEGEGPATFQDPSVAFSGGNVLLTGDLTQPIQAELIASFNPLVVDGQAQVELESATLRGLPIPPQALGSVEQTLNNALLELTSSLPENYVVQQISVDEGTLTIIAVRTG